MSLIYEPDAVVEMTEEMINIVANGEEYAVEDGLPLPEFLDSQGLHIDRVVVERNGAALTPGEAKEARLTSGDKFEIVRIVAGG